MGPDDSIHHMANTDVRMLARTVTALVKTLSPRNRDIVSRRFGLKSGTKETLESIGKSYGITRERVRQIEEFSLTQLAKASPGHKDLERLIQSVREHIIREGGITRERQLFKDITGSDKDTVGNAALVFALTLDRQLVRLAEGDRFHAFWATDSQQGETFGRMVAALAVAFKDQGGAQSEKESVNTAQDKGMIGFDGLPFNERHLQTVLSVCKEIGTNIYGQVGLSAWAEIRPKGVRDKAYLVMKKVGNPQHFTDIAKLINGAKFDSKRVNVQTVHNELIKDRRFVLVGRGLYALSEWGYKSVIPVSIGKSTINHIISNLLRELSKPLRYKQVILSR